MEVAVLAAGRSGRSGHVLREDVAGGVAHDEDGAQVADERADDVALLQGVGAPDRSRLLSQRAVEAAHHFALPVEVDEPLFRGPVDAQEAIDLDLLFSSEIGHRGSAPDYTGREATIAP